MDTKDAIEEYVDSTMNGGSESEVDSGSDDNEVFDLNVDASSDEESSDEEEDNAAEEDSDVERERRIARAMSSSDDGDDDDDDEGDDDDIAWGSRKQNFYGADDVEEEEEAEMEEKEAMRLQKKQLAELDEDDFDVPEGDEEEEHDKAKESKRQKKKIGSDVLDIANAAAMGDDTAVADDVEQIKKDVSGMSKKEQIRMLMKSSPELLGLLEDLRSHSAELSEQIQPILLEVESGLLPTSSGVSYLEVKSHLLLTYLINLTFYLLLKAEGKSVKDHPVISQLVSIRSLIEQTRPLDGKLKNQIDRVLALATDAEGAGAARPRPEDMVSMEEEAEERGLGGVYRAPKRTAVPYTGDEYSREEQKADRAKEKLRKSKLLRELRSEFSEAPEVFEMEHKDKMTEKAEEQEQERTRYEEENFTRLPMTKEQKKLERAARQRHARFDILGDLENFGDLDKLMEQAEQGDLASSVMDEERQKAKKKLLKHTVNEIETAERGRMERMLNAGGDVDLPRKDASTLRANYYRRAAAEASDDESEPRKRRRVNPDAVPGDDDFYVEAARTKAEKARRKKEEADARAQQAVEAVMSAVGADVVDGKRKASKKIIKNKGLTKYRRSDLKTPRARQRQRFEKAVKRRRGQVPDMRKDVGNYEGETTGIRKTLTRSRKIVGQHCHRCQTGKTP